MQMVKMFDWFEDIQPYLDTLSMKYNLCDLDACLTDGAVSFWVCKDTYCRTPFENTLVDYFLSQGCKEGETVYIWIC